MCLFIPEYTDIWLQSIHSISTLGEKLIPNVILVGTHIDELGSNVCITLTAYLIKQKISNDQEQNRNPATET